VEIQFRFMEKYDAVGLPYDRRNRLLSMNSLTKSFGLVAANIAEAEVGVYSACYKLGLFMVLYRMHIH
jgi:hypothetical protein